MKRIFGAIIVIISLIGIVFLRHYTGKIIIHPNLWILFFVVSSLFGIWVIGSFSKAVEKKAAVKNKQDLDQFKKNSNKIILDFESCKFMSGSSYEQTENEDLSAVLVLTPYRLSYLAETSSITEVEKSCLIYDIVTGKNVLRYSSETFPFSQITLESYVMDHKVLLYIDRFDKTKYIFDLNI